MKAILSTTYDDNYLFFIPIVQWCWNKLGVDCIIFAPHKIEIRVNKYYLVKDLCKKSTWEYFISPANKEATYAQCSRLFGGALQDISNDEILITSDADMAIFSHDITNARSGINIWGTDLVPEKQFPICYISASKLDWQQRFGVKGLSVQNCLDNLLGHIEAEQFRGNYWGKDQETAWNMLHTSWYNDHLRARPGTQFSTNRVDRDDSNWRHYLGPDLFDAHLWRPGYADRNFANIMELLTTQYPDENFKWLVDYRNEYIKLL